MTAKQKMQNFIQ